MDATGSKMGQPLNMEQAEKDIFGVVLMNDWSARDIQVSEEYPSTAAVN